MFKAVFIDKDGTLIKNVPYNVDPHRIALYQGANEALQLLKQNGFKVIIISNQPGVALGYFKEPDLRKVNERLQELLEESQVKLDGFYYCPHHPEATIDKYRIQCECRKPLPGMILKAAQDLNIDLTKSWMIGDILHDVEAGNKAGCKTILIDNGNETEWEIHDERLPTYLVKEILDAANTIIQHEKIRAV